MALTLPAPEDKAAMVEAMFDRIAPRYDLLNRLLTLRLDQGWRRLALRLLAVGPGDLLVDLGCGTGDLCELGRAAGARVVGVDVSAGMLARARGRGAADALLRTDACRLPLRDACVSVITSAFALRNVASIPSLLSEAARVLRPGGRLALLEVDEPRHPLMRWGHGLYFRHVVPLLGALLSDGAAYAYLPASTAYLPPEPELLAALTTAGFRHPRKRRLAAGIAQLWLAER